jgi:hypothetical protein
MLNESATAVREAVKSRVERGRDMDLHYDHPILLLWHEGYHHGQMKLALMAAGRPIRSGSRAGHVGRLEAQEVSGLRAFPSALKVRFASRAGAASSSGPAAPLPSWRHG